MRYTVGEPIPPEFLTAAGINRLLETIDELRAVLRPHLDDPWVLRRRGPYWDEEFYRECFFCVRDEPEHAADCPVLSKDALLGRPPTP